MPPMVFMSAGKTSTILSFLSINYLLLFWSPAVHIPASNSLPCLRGAAYWCEQRSVLKAAHPYFWRGQTSVLKHMNSDSTCLSKVLHSCKRATVLHSQGCGSGGAEWGRQTCMCTFRCFTRVCSRTQPTPGGDLALGASLLCLCPPGTYRGKAWNWGEEEQTASDCWKMESSYSRKEWEICMDPTWD
jgi:hypothetical protein